MVPTILNAKLYDVNTAPSVQDASDPFAFGGFFSADSINEAVRISKQRQQHRQDDDGSSDEEAGDSVEDSDCT